MHTQNLLILLGGPLQCDSSILEAIYYSLPPCSRDIWRRLSDDCSFQKLINHLRSIPGWKSYQRGYSNETLEVFKIGSPCNEHAFPGQLELDWSNPNNNHLYEQHSGDPNYFSHLIFDKSDNLFSLSIIHRGHDNRCLPVADFNREMLLNLKTLKEQLLFANFKLYELLKIN